MAEGSFIEASRIFEELASAAVKRGIPRAPQLYLQAGNATLKTGEYAPAISLFLRGLHLMDEMGQIRRLPAASQRVLDEFHSLGLEDEYKALESEIIQLLTRRNLNLPSTAPPKKDRLPGKCPQCGGIVHPQEVDWIDSTKASCDYCGSILEASS
jgi:hypothetical protein